MAVGRKTRRGRMLVEKQERFGRLIAQGFSNAEACRVVGINGKTGTRWRYGRKILITAGEAVHYPPVTLNAPAAPHPRYLSSAERTIISDLHRAGVGVCDIAEELGRAASTISRELRRNADDHGRYLPNSAQRLSSQRRSHVSRVRKVMRDRQLHDVVAELLGKRWSPEQFAHELRLRFPEQPTRHLSVETIYQAIYDPRIDLTRPAKRRCRRRRRQMQGAERRGRIPDMTMITDRPAEVQDRTVPGHWEGDWGSETVQRWTLVERMTRFVILSHLPVGRPTAAAMRDGITTALGTFPPGLRRTLTWDQGKELALHRHICANIGTRVYFCDAHSPGLQRKRKWSATGLFSERY